MARPKSFRDLIAWQKAMDLARLAYRLTASLPSRESYALVAQIRRAAISVPSNIAEGHGRLTDLQFRHFLGNARGSLYELETQVELAGDLGYVAKPQVQELTGQSAEVGRIINGLLVSLRPRSEPSHPHAAHPAGIASSARHRPH